MTCVYECMSSMELTGTLLCPPVLTLQVHTCVGGIMSIKADDHKSKLTIKTSDVVN